MIYLCLIPLGVALWFALIGWALAWMLRRAVGTVEGGEGLRG